MREELTRLLRAHPFVPFIVSTRDGEAYAVASVELLSVGLNVCAIVDADGYIRLIPYHAIDKVVTRESQEIQ